MSTGVKWTPERVQRIIDYAETNGVAFGTAAKKLKENVGNAYTARARLKKVMRQSTKTKTTITTEGSTSFTPPANLVIANAEIIKTAIIRELIKNLWT